MGLLCGFCAVMLVRFVLLFGGGLVFSGLPGDGSLWLACTSVLFF